MFTSPVSLKTAGTTALLALLAVLGTACDGDTPQMTDRDNGAVVANDFRAGPFLFAIELEPETPRVGDNRLSLRLSDSRGTPVAGAHIKAVAEMPAMGSMPAMQAPADMTEIRPGLYRGSFEPSMEGAWPLTLEIRHSLGSARVSFDLATGRRGLQLAAGANHVGGAARDGDMGGDMEEEAPPGTVTLDIRRRQLIGVKTAFAEMQSLRRSIRAVGRVAYDETRLADVSLKFDAWVGELHADYLGFQVSRGEPLFSVYGPELLAAQQEYLQLLRRAGNPALLAAARKRLALWGMTAEQLRALARRGEAQDYVTVHAPINGVVVSKTVVAGSAHRAGTTLMRLADLTQLWVEADVYESELPLLHEGMAARVSLPYLPGREFAGTVVFIAPQLDPASRSARLRLVIDNSEGLLKPDMYAEVQLDIALGERLVVPEAAVIIAGSQRLVFEDIGEGRLAPRTVITGQRGGGFIEILAGLEAGDCVVTSGNFLIASESRLKAGMQQW